MIDDIIADAEERMQKVNWAKEILLQRAREAEMV